MSRREKMSVEEALGNRAFVLKTHRKLKQALMKRGANGMPVLQDALYRMDVPREAKVDCWGLGDILRTQGELRLSSTEIAVLFRMHDYDGDGLVDVDEFLAAVRGRLSCTHQQIEDIFKALRAGLRHSGLDLPRIFPCVDFTQPLRGVVLSAAQFNKYMFKARPSLDLTPSDILFLYAHMHKDGVVPVEDFVRQLSKKRSTPEDVINRILLKLRDSVEDPHRARSGGIGLKGIFDKIGGVAKKNRVPLYSFDRFVFGMSSFGSSLSDSEAATLFEALQRNEYVNILSLTNVLQQNPPLVAAADVAHLVEKLRGELLASPFKLDGQPHVLPAVRILAAKKAAALAELLTKNDFSHSLLEKCYLDIFSFGAVIREILTAMQFPDIEVEVIFNQYSEPVRKKKIKRRKPRGADPDPQQNDENEDEDEDDFYYAERCIDIDAFIEQALLPPLPPVHAFVVGEAWKKVSPSGNPVLFNDFLGTFDPAELPCVATHETTPYDVVQEMQRFFEAQTEREQKALSGPFASANGPSASDFKLTGERFRAYWTDVFFSMGEVAAGVSPGLERLEASVFLQTVLVGFGLKPLGVLLPAELLQRPQQQQQQHRDPSLPHGGSSQVSPSHVSRTPSSEGQSSARQVPHVSPSGRHPSHPHPSQPSHPSHGQQAHAVQSHAASQPHARPASGSLERPVDPPSGTRRGLSYPPEDGPEAEGRPPCGGGGGGSPQFLHALPGSSSAAKSPNKSGRRMVSSQGVGGGRSSLNLFGGGPEEVPQSARSEHRRMQGRAVAQYSHHTSQQFSVSGTGSTPSSARDRGAQLPPNSSPVHSAQSATPREAVHYDPVQTREATPLQPANANAAFGAPPAKRVGLTGSKRAATSVGIKQFHTQRPF